MSGEIVAPYVVVSEVLAVDVAPVLAVLVFCSGTGLGLLFLDRRPLGLTRFQSDGLSTSIGSAALDILYVCHADQVV